MKIENIKIQFNENLRGITRMSEVQVGYLSHLQAGSTIRGLVEVYLQHGWLVNFVELVNLIEILIANKAIENSIIIEYFKTKNSISLADQITNFFSLKVNSGQHG